MSTARLQATAADELPVYLDAPDGPILALLTRPPGQANGQAALLCPGGWFGTATNRNRLLVRIARQLAGAGYHVLRWDWHGVGESAGTLDRYRLDAPFTGDVLAGARYLVDAGFPKLALVGLCFGSRTAFAASSVLAPRLTSLVLVSFPVPAGPGGRPGRAGDPGTAGLVRLAMSPTVLTSMVDPAVRRAYRKQARVRWRGVRRRLLGGEPSRLPQRAMTSLDPETVRAQLEVLGGARVPTLLLFGENDPQYAAFSRFGGERLAAFLDEAQPGIQVTAAPGDLSGFGSLEAQQEAIDRTVGWVIDYQPTTDPDPAGSPR